MKYWKPRCPMTPHEAWAAFEALTYDELAQLLTVEWRCPTILKRDGKIGCRALQKAVGFEMHKVGNYMRILHGLTQIDTDVPPEPEQAKPEPPAPAVVKLTADMRKLADAIDAVSQESITTSVHEATERAQSAYEAQIRAADTRIAGMSAQLDDLEYTNIEMISYAYALDKRVAALIAENDRVRAERDEAHAEIATMTTAQTLAEQQHTSLRTEIADVRGANLTLVTTLAEARQERDAYPPGLNGPFDAPREHWKIEPDRPALKLSGRRNAEYFYRPPGAKRARAAGNGNENSHYD